MTDYKNRLERIMERFLNCINYVLIFSMAVITFGVIGLIARDIYVFYSSKFATGIGMLLGSLLILWVLAELIRAQLDQLKGGESNIGVFVLVAIVAFVRKLMVFSLSPEKTEIAYYPSIVILTLGVVYWLIKKS